MGRARIRKAKEKRGEAKNPVLLHLLRRSRRRRQLRWSSFWRETDWRRQGGCAAQKEMEEEEGSAAVIASTDDARFLRKLLISPLLARHT